MVCVQTAWSPDALQLQHQRQCRHPSEWPSGSRWFSLRMILVLWMHIYISRQRPVIIPAMSSKPSLVFYTHNRFSKQTNISAKHRKDTREEERSNIFFRQDTVGEGRIPVHGLVYSRNSFSDWISLLIFTSRERNTKIRASDTLHAMDGVGHACFFPWLETTGNATSVSLGGFFCLSPQNPSSEHLEPKQWILERSFFKYFFLVQIKSWKTISCE